MRILLTGKDGQVGFELRRALAPLGIVFAVDQVQCDLRNVDAIRKLVRSVQPTVIVNPAAYTAVDKAETDQDTAHAVNAVAPGIFGEEAARIGALMIHFSTDYVFDGKKEGFYRETDSTSPQSVYGSTKLAGEQALLATGARSLILRTSWVVGAHGNNFAKTMLRLAAERKSLNVVADQFGAPTSAALLSDVTAHLIRQSRYFPENAFPYGIYHAAAGGVTNWHEYACYVIERARIAGRNISVELPNINAVRTEDYPTSARRPANSKLDTSKLCNTFELCMPDWREGLDHILDQIF